MVDCQKNLLNVIGELSAIIELEREIGDFVSPEALTVLKRSVDRLKQVYEYEYGIR